VTSRSQARFGTYVRALARRFFARAKTVLTEEPGQQTRDEAEIAGAQEIARSAAQLKGGMAKVAQMMAYQMGPGAALDPEARQSLAFLWDRVPGADHEAIRRVIVEDLGAPPEELFATWDPTPIAAASLGQVHAATGKDGTRYAVKVQYPMVAEGLRSDLESRSVLQTLAGSEVGGNLSPESIEALRDAILGELDYKREAAMLERFARLYEGDPQIVLPRVSRELSSGRVLTATFLEGQSLPSFIASADDEARTRVALTIFRFGWGAPLQHRLLNADPNPGNYLVLDAAKGTVGFLDFGCSVELDEKVIDADRRLWKAMLARDGEKLRHAVYEQGLIGRMITLDSNTFREWERYLAGAFLSTLHIFTGATLRDFTWTPNYAQRLAELTSHLVQAGGMVLPPEALLLWRQRLGVAAVLGSLRPTADFHAALQAVVRAFSL
jgi:predicted unusual protein kinase regulating ubiquinone biosynthesis (AarF/ABC1/UbiB family)